MRIKIFGFKEKYVDFSFIDFYTTGHFIFGYISQLLVYILFHVCLGLPNNPGVFVVISINIGISWEFIENFYLQKKGYKFDNRVDSFANSLTDVLFVDIGAITCAFITINSLKIIFIVSIIILAIMVALMEVLRKITFNNENDKNGKILEKV